MADPHVNEIAEINIETIACPLCAGEKYSPWAAENGFCAVTCSDCGLIYVNPRPSLATIDRAVRAGAHREETLQLNVVSRRVSAKVEQYRKVVAEMFRDVVEKGEPISWLDVGAGFGEVVEAVAKVVPAGSRVEGLEPMKPKVAQAKARGVAVREGYLSDINDKYGVVSVINVFSHVPDFKQFLQEIKGVLTPNGEVLLETGNAGDIGNRNYFPGPLTLPDHLVFAGERHIRRFLEQAGFELVQIKRIRIDGLVYSIKNLVKRLLGQPVAVSLPYTSPSRTVLFRARSVS